MLKLKIIIEAGDDVYGFNKGERLELINDVFNKDNGLAFNELKKGWKVVFMEILQYSKINQPKRRC